MKEPRLSHPRRPHRSGAALALALLAMGGAACADAGAEDRPEPQPAARAARVETLTVAAGAFDETIRLTGVVEAINDVSLAAEAFGTVEYIAAPGTNVEKDAVVARLEQALAQATVQQAEAQLRTAESQRAIARDNHERLAPLQERRVISAREFEQSRLQLEQAEAGVRQSEAALAHARAQLDDTVVRAPFRGRVESRFLEKGERAGTGDPLVRVVSVDRVRVIAGVPERYAADLRVDVDVSLGFASSGLEPRRGTVSFVGAAIDPQSRTFAIEVDVPNPGGALKPAMLAELHIARTRHADVITVPRSAVVFDELGPGVYVVSAAGGVATARRRPIILGADAAGFVIVRSGLDPGDEVIVLGQNSVSEGDRVEVSRNHPTIAEPATAGNGGRTASRP